jgi:hypothetical protein
VEQKRLQLLTWAIPSDSEDSELYDVGNYSGSISISETSYDTKMF